MRRMSTSASWTRCLTIALVLVLPTLAWPSAGMAQEPEPALIGKLKYRLIGPTAGGRICRVAGVPGDPFVYYAGTASGGLWKSGDGGLNWKPIFDDQPASSIGSLAVSPADPNVIYVGTGEANIRGNVVDGNGIYKTINGGKTWQHVWKQKGQIGTLIVHPTNPDIAFAAVLGHLYGPNPERGVYRTRDGGKTWLRVLHKDKETGASDVCFDPSNPQILFAGLWQARRRPWEMTSGGPGSGLHVSLDGGDTWKQLGPREKGKGLPEGPWGKVGVAVAPSDGRRVYAVIEAENGGLFRSDDGGSTWQLGSSDGRLRQRAWYYSTITVHPMDPNTLWCPNIPLLKSIDGGKTFEVVQGPHHGDHHDLWVDPKNPRRIIDGNDGGVDISTNGGESWYTPRLPITQLYHIACDNRTPYHVSGTMQDLGTLSGPSNSLALGGIALSDWHPVGGGEAGYTAPDPSNPDIVYAGEYGGYISRYNHKTGQVRNVSIYPYMALGKSGEELRYRFQWTAPILVSPHDSRVVYHAGNVLFKTSDGGKHWTATSPDLTRNDKTKQKWSGGPITGDNTGVEIYGTIFALAESSREKGLLWAGSDDGLVHLSRDGGKNWANVTENIKGLPEWGTVACIEASRFDPGTAYVVIDAHRLDDTRPYLFRTSDFGKTWKNLAATLPQEVYLHVVREDPTLKGLLYVGTERGVVYSRDDGTTWRELKLNLPTVPVHDLVVKNNDLVVGTHGRSIWILDDLTPLRELTEETIRQPTHLFSAQDAIRYRYGRNRFAKTVAENPPGGAVIHYYLKTKSKGDIELQILDTRKQSVAVLTSKEEKNPGKDGFTPADVFWASKPVLATEAGLHRVVWNLCHAGPTGITDATALPPAPSWGPLVAPGTYTLKLTVDGKTMTTPLVVRPDPRVEKEEAGYEEQIAFGLALGEDITHLSALVQRLQAVKQQLAARNELWKTRDGTRNLVNLSQELIGKLDSLEAKLHNPKAKIYADLIAHRQGAQLYSQMNSLFWWSVASDGAPTQGMREVYAQHKRSLQEREGQLGELLEKDLAHVNRLAKELDLLNILVPSTTLKKK